jgi:phytoene/squalene synthetase
VLYLGRCHDERTRPLSDSICTGLQLANFCQDVARDFDRGRVYLPFETWNAHGIDEALLARREYSAAFRGAMIDEVERARWYLEAGRPLVNLVPRALRCDVALFIEGGLGILDAIRHIDYDVWHRRPTVSKRRQFALLARCWWRTRWPARSSGAEP